MIGAWLTGRWAVGLLACVALAAAVWFAGDVVALGAWRPLDSTAERMVFLVAVVAAWLAWEVLRQQRKLKENARLLESLAGGIADQDSAARAAHEIEVLRQRFEEALGVLRHARFRGADGERRTVSELPWYMFIGGPGSGKTTALLNAGLRFPLGDPGTGNTLQGVGGTRNCDWWFTDEAVLLDTAGRYTTQGSDKQADAAAWLGFLDLLKRFRPHQPLNGAIVTLNAADLAHWNEEELSTYAAHVRERVWELYTRLGVRLPLYLLITKADLLAGFSEYFSEFDAAERAQVWGVTFGVGEFAADPLAMVARFDDDFRQLERRLYAMLPARLQEERDLQRRAAVYRFPQQFRGTGPMIASFLESAFGTGWSGEAPLLRGVYFASGTQEGSPIDRVLGTLARSFNLERKVQPPTLGSGKSFFLRRLLREVIFGESGLAGSNPAQQRQRRMERIAAYGGMAAASLLLIAGWTTSYFGNLRLIEATASRAGEAKRELDALATLRPVDEARLVSALNRLRDLRQGGAAWTTGFGLYQGTKLDAQAERAYQNALREILLPQLAAAEAWRLPGNLQKDLAAHIRSALALRGAKA
ncbi:MAG TPA: type VI secretion system membrane subunit TssM [Burkholderiales bacterium]